MSKKVKKLVPELRFSEFEGDWEEKRLEKLFSEFKSGNGITSDEISEHGSYPVFGGNGLRGYAETYTHDGFYFLIGRQGALCGNINRTNGKAFISEHAIACKANKTSDTEWLAQRLDYYNLNRLSESSAQPGLSVKKLLRFKLFVPKLEEQEKISSFLGAIALRITQLRRKHELLEIYKKGVMQKIFSQQIRFKQDDGKPFPDWEKKKLGELLDFKNGINADKSQYGSGKKFINVLDIINDAPIYHDSIIGSVEITTKEFEKNNVKYGDILFQRSSEIREEAGQSNIYLDNNQEATFGGFVIRGRPKVNFNPIYLNYLLKTRSIRKEITDRSGGSTRFNVGQNSLSQVPILICESAEEQEKIANLLTFVDKKIEIVKLQIDSIEKFKNGLLQKMFV